jgi:hypothetical protein
MWKIIAWYKGNLQEVGKVKEHQGEKKHWKKKRKEVCKALHLSSEEQGDLQQVNFGENSEEK